MSHDLRCPRGAPLPAPSPTSFLPWTTHAAAFPAQISSTNDSSRAPASSIRRASASDELEVRGPSYLTSLDPVPRKCRTLARCHLEHAGLQAAGLGRCRKQPFYVVFQMLTSSLSLLLLLLLLLLSLVYRLTTRWCVFIFPRNKHSPCLDFPRVLRRQISRLRILRRATLTTNLDTIRHRQPMERLPPNGILVIRCRGPCPPPHRSDPPAPASSSLGTKPDI